MRCPRCGWPIKLSATKKVMATRLTSFTCMNPRCRHEQTEIARASS